MCDRRNTGFPILLGTILLFILLGCSSQSSSNSPRSVAARNFEAWARTPYRNERFDTIENDGTFASVLVTAEFRENANSDWVEQEAVVDCKKVGSDWSCDTYFRFSLSRSLVQLTQEAVLQATREREQIQDSIKVEVVDVFATSNSVVVVYEVTNSDDVAHKVFPKFEFSYTCKNARQSRENIPTYPTHGYYNIRKLHTVTVSPGQTVSGRIPITYFSGYSAKKLIESCEAVLSISAKVVQPDVDEDYMD